MENGLLVALTVGVCWVMLAMRVPLFLWLLTALLAAVGFYFMGVKIPFTIFTALTLVFVFFAARPVRRLVLTKPLFKWFQSVLPPVSQTERDALEAGDVWWEAELLQGRPNWQKFLNLPIPTLTSEEQNFIDNQTAKLCKMLNEWQITHELNDLPPEVWNYIKKEKFFALHIPKEWGGLGFSALANSTIVQQIATCSMSAAITVMVPNSLGPAELLLKYGTDEQKKRYLPKLATGEEVPCFGLTGVDAGSDAGSITDKGVVCKQNYEGKEVLGIRLNWNKRYITLAPVATLLGLAFKLHDPDHLLGDKEELGITLCLIPTNFSGVEIGARHNPLDQSFMNGPTRGQDVFVPFDLVIGGIERAGKGWRMLMDCLSVGRGISLPALAVGMSKVCYRSTGAYAAVRKQFGMPIGQFEGVADALAKIGGYTYMLESSRLLTTTGIDQHIKPAVVSAIAKYHMTEQARVVINHAMDIHGGRGIICGPRNYLAAMYQSTPIAITVEGANILTRNLIIFGQGAIRCHPFIFQEMEAATATNQKEGLTSFDKAFFKHIGYTCSNFSRLVAHSLTAGLFLNVKGIQSQKCSYRQLNYMSLALACLTDVALLSLGGNLKRREKISARIGDILSYLYLSSAVLKYHHDQGCQLEERPYVMWCINNNLFKMQEAFISLMQNFPNRFWANLLLRLVFPLGRKFKQPSDELEIEISRHMMKDSQTRDRLTKYLHIGDQEHPIGRVEAAFQGLLSSKAIFDKLNKAVRAKQISRKIPLEQQISQALQSNIITQQEADVLNKFEQMRLEAIHVDEFASSH